MASNPADSELPAPRDKTPSSPSDKYRGATIEDLGLPPALSVSSEDPISTALTAAFEREYTHLTVTSPTKRSLLGYLRIPHIRELLDSKSVNETDPVSAAMHRFNRNPAEGVKYTTITPYTPLEELAKFFRGEFSGEKQDFAVVTDENRKFVIGVVTDTDLAEFEKRRPSVKIDVEEST